MIRYNPSKLKLLSDRFEAKQPSDAPIFGKPNIIINPQSLEFTKYVNMALSNFSPSEMVSLAEKYS